MTNSGTTEHQGVLRCPKPSLELPAKSKGSESIFKLGLSPSSGKTCERCAVVNTFLCIFLNFTAILPDSSLMIVGCFNPGFRTGKIKRHVA